MDQDFSDNRWNCFTFVKFSVNQFIFMILYPLFLIDNRFCVPILLPKEHSSSERNQSEQPKPEGLSSFGFPVEFQADQPTAAGIFVGFRSAEPSYDFESKVNANSFAKPLPPPGPSHPLPERRLRECRLLANLTRTISGLP